VTSPEFVHATNDQQDDLVACVRAVRTQLAALVVNLPTPNDRAAIRARLIRLGELADLVAVERVTIVMPGARRAGEGTPT
jgi:hypothetical protein